LEVCGVSLAIRYYRIADAAACLAPITGAF
jgi:hypothetical protein